MAYSGVEYQKAHYRARRKQGGCVSCSAKSPVYTQCLRCRVLRSKARAANRATKRRQRCSN